MSNMSGTSRTDKLIGTTLILMLVTFITKLIGFVREIFIAAKFGTSEAVDIFVAVQTIPSIILTILGGALAAVLVPMIIRLRQENEELRLRTLLNNVFSLTSLTMLAISILAYIFVRPLTNVYVFGFSDAAKAMTVELFQVVTPAFIVIGLISLTTSVLNAYRVFVIPALGPAIYSLGVIIGVVFFADDFGIKSLTIGFTIALVVQIIILIIAFFRHIRTNQGQRFRFNLRIEYNDDLVKFGHLLFPFLISIGVFQLNIVVDKMMASTLPAGNLSALNYAYKVTQLPIAIFVGTLVLPLFPLIAESIAKNDTGDAKLLLKRSSRLLGILLLPVIGIFVMMAEPIISIIYQRGSFDEKSLALTSVALIFYTFMILPFAMRDVVTRVFYALQDTWTPVINSVFIVALNVILMVIFVPIFGIIAVAGSTSISAIFGYLRLRHKLVEKIGPLNATATNTQNVAAKVKIDKTWLRIIINAIIFTIASWGLYQILLLSIWPNPLGADLWLRTLVSLLVGGIIYILLTIRLNTEEVNWLKRKLKRR